MNYRICTCGSTVCKCLIPVQPTDVSQIWYEYSRYKGYSEPFWDIKLRKVENGWIAVKNSKEYILSDVSQVSELLKDE